MDQLKLHVYDKGVLRNGNVSFYGDQCYSLEMHKVRIIQKLNLLPIEERLAEIAGAGYNTFLLQHEDVFLDIH